MDPIIISSIEQLDHAACMVLESVKPNRIICLYGSMGAGKTTFIQSLCRALGVADVVVSPTFALVNEYRSADGSPVYHFDFYRINKIEEVYDFGYEEYFYSSQGICFIEWPELVENLLPREGVVRIKIDVLDNSIRKISRIS